MTARKVKPLRELTAADVTFTVEVEAEEISHVGNGMDADLETWITARLEADQQEAWCYLSVTAEWGDYTGYAGLGGCSFDCGQHPTGDRVRREVEAYAKSEGLYEDALRELNDKVEAAYRRLQPLARKAGAK